MGRRKAETSAEPHGHPAACLWALSGSAAQRSHEPRGSAREARAVRCSTTKTATFDKFGLPPSDSVPCTRKGGGACTVTGACMPVPMPMPMPACKHTMHNHDSLHVHSHV